MTRKEHILHIEPTAVLVEIKQYGKAGELISVATLLPPQDEKPKKKVVKKKSAQKP